MSTVRQSDPVLLESYFGLLWCPVQLLYPFLLSLKVSRKYENKLPKNAFDIGWFSIKRDATDMEWTSFRGMLCNQLFIMFTYSVVGAILSNKFPKYKKFYYSIAGAFLVIIFISFEGFVFVFTLVTSFYFLLQLRNQTLMWMFILTFLVCFHTDTYRHYLFSLFGIKVLHTINTYVSVLMTVLRLISYGTETINSSTSSFFEYMCYLFYYPLFFQGPVLTFDLFIIDFNKPKVRFNTEFIFKFLWCCIIGLAIDVYFHFSFVNALSANINLLQTLNEIEAISVGWTLMVLFILKYKVFYGLANIFSKLNGIEAPAPPKIVCTWYTLVDMWRYFDQGFYRLLQRSIYFQMGGSHQSILRTSIASLLCFAFVSLWHGNDQQHWYWGLLNWLGICFEHCIKKIVRSKSGEKLHSIIGCKMHRRIVGVNGSLTYLFLVYSNLVFVTSIESANLIYLQALSKWYFPTIIVTVYLAIHLTHDFNEIKNKTKYINKQV
ncbi:protein-cysteine N-palmitoyltransferase HHAT isoform X1 [Hydra vulgaris]